MDDQLVDEKLQEALRLHDAGKSYADIRQLFNDELDEDTIAYIIRLVDEFAIEESRIEEEVKKAKYKMYFGLVVFGISAFIIYKFYIDGSLTGAISLLAYLPMVFALYLLWNGYKDEVKFKKMQPEIDDTKFRMKRRKKN